ncbi:MAG: hypothetical protein R3308_10815, partial [Thiohalobacterales bacterium]|nr:hypothetical protein [Thiohalobacterales bacterium]
MTPGITASRVSVTAALLCCACLHTGVPAGPVPVGLPPGGSLALQAKDRLQGGTLAYRPWTDPASGAGDIIEYSLGPGAGLQTDVLVGRTPP